MFERLKRVLVESFVGAIALGYLLAQCIQQFVNIFASPVVGWVRRNEYRDVMQVISPGKALPGFSLRESLPYLAEFLFLALVWYYLLRWLYFTPLKKVTSPPAPNLEDAA
jgi:hypothetical protein